MRQRQSGSPGVETASTFIGSPASQTLSRSRCAVTSRQSSVDLDVHATRVRELKAGSSQMPEGPTPAASFGGPLEGAFRITRDQRGARPTSWGSLRPVLARHPDDDEAESGPGVEPAVEQPKLGCAGGELKEEQRGGIGPASVKGEPASRDPRPLRRVRSTARTSRYRDTR